MFANLYATGNFRLLDRVDPNAIDSFEYTNILLEDTPAPCHIEADFTDHTVYFVHDEPEPVIPPPKSDIEILKEELDAEKERTTFLEDCIAEMAMEVYKPTDSAV